MENSIIVSQVGIAGSTKLGRGVLIGGQTGIAGHITLGDHVMVGARSGVHDDVRPSQIVSGSPHLPHRQWLRVEACVALLPEMRKTIASLLKRVEELETKIKKE
jgi:UDP-3-O-[3-hydroxymyristoyl] glucosamine N-acyltransferase